MERLSIRQRLSRYICKGVSAWYLMNGCEIGSNCRISKSAIIGRANPQGKHKGERNVSMFIQTMVLAHDYSQLTVRICGAIPI